MVGIILGTIGLSIIHALIPNHWMPIITISHAQKWTERELIFGSILISVAHVIATVILGILMGMVGIKLSEEFSDSVQYFGPLILVIIGIIYFSINLPHDHVHHENLNKHKSKNSVLTALVVMMFFSPCIEVVTFFLSAGAYGFSNVILLAIIYALCTVTSIVSIIYLGYKGLAKLKFHFFEHHEKRISGLILIIVGMASFFIHA